ncbi:MAG: hypothetical protein DMF60_21835 [Acidobacteria bacterium]|nr:MAG: hypothetical protein DMF60_21835 [Acidobacteriota bacterium]
MKAGIALGLRFRFLSPSFLWRKVFHCGKTSENSNAVALAMTPEEKARQTIDDLLLRCGWEVQSMVDLNLSAGFSRRRGT